MQPAPTELVGVKANNAAGNKSLSNENTKRPKLQQEASGSVEGAAGVMYPSLRIHLRS